MSTVSLKDNIDKRFEKVEVRLEKIEDKLRQ